jgi:hypothetical protein
LALGRWRFPVMFEVRGRHTGLEAENAGSVLLWVYLLFPAAALWYAGVVSRGVWRQDLRLPRSGRCVWMTLSGTDMPRFRRLLGGKSSSYLRITGWPVCSDPTVSGCEMAGRHE